MDRYTARVTLHGNTHRERMKNRLKDSISQRAVDSLSCKEVKINGEESLLVIDSGTQPYYKSFSTIPNNNTNINIGDYVEWSNSVWLVVSCDSDGEIYKDGRLEQCNYLLRWQNDKGEIIERWCIIASASKYNDGTMNNRYVSLGSDQLSVVLPLDEESVRLHKSIPKRFFIDSQINMDSATYELTGTGNVPDTYNGYGVTSWIVKECDYTPTEKDLEYGVCDWKDFDNQEISTLPPTNTEVEEEVKETFSYKEATITGIREIKIGYSKTYTAKIVDSKGYEVHYDKIDFGWNVVADFDVLQTIVDDNKIKLSIDSDDRLINSSFKLQALIDGNVVSEIEIDIIDLF